MYSTREKDPICNVFPIWEREIFGGNLEMFLYLEAHKLSATVLRARIYSEDLRVGKLFYSSSSSSILMRRDFRNFKS
jgi:hypothetical protein